MTEDEQVRHVSWWVHEQIAAGRSDEQIERELPVAVAHLTSEPLDLTLSGGHRRRWWHRMRRRLLRRTQ